MSFKHVVEYEMDPSRRYNPLQIGDTALAIKPMAAKILVETIDVPREGVAETHVYQRDNGGASLDVATFSSELADIINRAFEGISKHSHQITDEKPLTARRNG